jgi:folate-dependent phosphoribosylglycinamide formyltransferase PurN
MKELIFFLEEKIVAQNVVIFMSGSGTNAENVLEYVSNRKPKAWIPSVIVTDAPKKSRASEIALKYNIPLIEHDIKLFYKKNGEKRVSLLTEKGREIRQKWTAELRKMLSPFQIDFGILAGFIPLTNITDDFPCLNVHPGDLTVEREGKRLLVGLHTLPIETAIINEITELRSSVIIAQTYTGKGGEMDTGPILGISTPIQIDFMGFSLHDLKAIARERPSQRPSGGYRDMLENVAKYNQECLKQHGDWVVLPRTVNDFALNKFAVDEENILYYRKNNRWIAINTVVYGKNVIKTV